MKTLAIAVMAISFIPMLQAQVAEQNREVGAFSGIHQSTSADVYITKGDSESVMVRADEDAIDKLSNPDLLGEGIPVIAKEGKYQFNLDHVMSENMVFINKLFIIRKQLNGTEIEIRELNGLIKLKALRNQFHRPGLIIGEKMKKRHNLYLRNLSRSIPIYLVKRPNAVTIEEFVEFMKRQIGSHD